MNVLIYGASNAIAINIARFLSRAGHTAIMADNDRYSRAFFSRSCGKKYLLRDPRTDGDGFRNDMAACLEREAIGLIVPTTDRTLLDLLDIQVVIPPYVLTPFPRDSSTVRYVMDKANLPELCARAGVLTPRTVRVDENFDTSAVDGLRAPFAIKRATGLGGEGFLRVEQREQLPHAVAAERRKAPQSTLLIQEYISGRVHGAGGLFDGEALRQFYAYSYVRRYPQSGSPTICRQQNMDALRLSLEKVLTTLRWNGYCQMDFIVDEKSGDPFLTDINPVHWYSIPFSVAAERHCLSRYLVSERAVAEPAPTAPYTTVSLLRELQRLLAGGVLRGTGPGLEKGYWEHYRHIRRNDWSWDPLPVVLAPVLKLLRLAAGREGAV